MPPSKRAICVSIHAAFQISYFFRGIPPLFRFAKTSAILSRSPVYLIANILRPSRSTYSFIRCCTSSTTFNASRTLQLLPLPECATPHSSCSAFSMRIKSEKSATDSSSPNKELARLRLSSKYSLFKGFQYKSGSF